jgi:flagellar protein FliS
MSGYSQAANIAAYRQVATHGIAMESDPHHLITMLMEGALARLQLGKTYIDGGHIREKAAVLHRVVEIINELRMSLDHSVGGRVAADMEQLYEYMVRRVMTANLNNDRSCLDEVVSLLGEIRNSWVAIPPAFRSPAKQGQ